MTPLNPSTGADSGKESSGRGAHIRTVIDHSAAWPCYVPVGRDLCQLKRGHVGGHLGYPDPWPREAISADNPRSERATPAQFSELYDPSPEPIDRRIS